MINGQHWGDVAFWFRCGATVALVALTTAGPAAAQMFFPPYGYPVPPPWMGRPAPPHFGVRELPVHPEGRAEIIDPDDNDDDDPGFDPDDEDRPRRQRTAAGPSRGRAAAHFRRQHAHRSTSKPAPSRLMAATPTYPRIATKVPRSSARSNSPAQVITPRQPYRTPASGRSTSTSNGTALKKSRPVVLPTADTSSAAAQGLRTPPRITAPNPLSLSTQQSRPSTPPPMNEGTKKSNLD